MWSVLHAFAHSYTLKSSSDTRPLAAPAARALALDTHKEGPRGP